jgi:hypothetical protein
MAMLLLVVCALTEVVNVGMSNNLGMMPTLGWDGGVFAEFLDTTVIVDAIFISHTSRSRLWIALE